jgi:formate hydrogenlyase subunit 6/NADH:ubiquinone oxidoreductase subunit I
MRTLIVYFSQTGNTENIARAIQSGVQQIAGHCDISAINDANPKRLYHYDLVGLGSPVHHLTEPANVTGFINRLSFMGGKPIFVFSTHGTLPYWFLHSIVPRLQRRGLVVIGSRDWYCSTSIQNQPEPYATDGHPDGIDLKEAADFGREMVERHHRISTGETGLIPPLPEKEPLPEGFGSINEVTARLNDEWRNNVKLNLEKCLYPECRLCMDNCPMYGIDLSLQPPVYAKPCISCLFCELICPTGAIDSKEWIEATAATEHKNIGEVYLKRLADAEAQGRFRRLVSLERIGWDTPHYKVHNQHPRWIIGKGWA